MLPLIGARVEAWPPAKVCTVPLFLGLLLSLDPSAPMGLPLQDSVAESRSVGAIPLVSFDVPLLVSDRALVRGDATSAISLVPSSEVVEASAALQRLIQPPCGVEALRSYHAQILP
jgi:hypothetical protein